MEIMIVLFEGHLMPLKIDYYVRVTEGGSLKLFRGVIVKEWFLSLLKNISEHMYKRVIASRDMYAFSVRPIQLLSRQEFSFNELKANVGDKLSFSVSILREDLEGILAEELMGVQEFNLGGLKGKREKVVIRRKLFKELMSFDLGARIGISFKTPTVLKSESNKHSCVFPEPIIIMSNLISMWNKFAPGDLIIPIEPTLARVRRMMKIKSYSLKTQEVLLGEEKVIGFSGKMELVIMNEGKSVSYVHPLLAFAEFSNIGVLNAYGLGVVEIVKLGGH